MSILMPPMTMIILDESIAYFTDIRLQSGSGIFPYPLYEKNFFIWRRNRFVI